jgi:hypothetical protein
MLAMALAVFGGLGVGDALAAQYKVSACGVGAGYQNHMLNASVSDSRMSAYTACPNDGSGHPVGMAAMAGIDRGKVPMFANATQSFIAPEGTTIRRVRVKAQGRTWNGDWASLLQASNDRFGSSLWNLSGCGGNIGSANGCVSAADNIEQNYEIPGATGVRAVVACGHSNGCTTFSTDVWPFTRAYYFVREFGTSYAAPQVGGGALLLAGAGIRDPKVVKAILIDSARPGRATPGDSMGTQTGWLPDWGWGELNLDAAYRERLNFARGEVPANGARFFRATAQAPGDRATLVWHRRVADCQPLRQGCYYDTSSGFRVYTLSNLDLAQYDAGTGAQLASSASAVDNVEQVRAASPGGVVYKVSAGQVDGPAGEPFAIAATRPLTPLVTPQPTVALSVDAGATMRPGDPVRVDATISNPSPDLGADNALVTLEPPAGVEILSGQRTQALGNLQPQGNPSHSVTASWTVRGTNHGLKQLVATATATKFGSTFRASATGSFNVDAEPPRVRISASADHESVVRVTWEAQDDSAVASFDVAASANGGSYAPWLTHTTQTAGEMPAAPGTRYRFRIRATDALGNSSPFLDSEEVTVRTSDGKDGGAGPPPPDPTSPVHATPSPELSITSTGMHGRRLLVRGTVALGASGRVTGTWRGRAGGRHRTARATTYAHLRRFKLSLRLPRHARKVGRLTVTYVGDRHFRSQVRHLRLTS